MSQILSVDFIKAKIFIIRGKRVMVDRDLARLYGVSTSRLNEQVKRNKKRFPGDFMFRLTPGEMKNWMSHFAISRSERIGIRKRFLVFTEQGVAMLSGILNSDRAIQVNIAIMRAFVKLRKILSAHKELAQKLYELERRIEKHDSEIQLIFEAIRRLMTAPPEKPRQKIGFHG